MSSKTKTQEKKYTIDPAHSRVEFTVSHMGFSKVRGSFGELEGTIYMVPGKLSTISAEAVVRIASINTHQEDRDAHLKSADFFDVEKYPELTFTSTSLIESTTETFTLEGDLTIRGITKKVQLHGRYLGEGVDPWGGTRIAVEASTKINRKDFGLNWNTLLETGGVLVGNEVEISLETQAVQEQSDEEE